MNKNVLPATIEAIKDKKKYIMNQLQKNTEDLKLMNEMQDGDQMDDTSFRNAIETRERLDMILREIDSHSVVEPLDLKEITDTKEIRVGHAVKVKVVYADKSAEELVLTLVSTLDVRYLQQRIAQSLGHNILVSVDTPLGKSIIGRSKGESIKYMTPDGEAQVKVIEISVSPLVHQIES